jgi:hypothetical protein
LLLTTLRTSYQVAAGAIWVQCEQALSAAQSGWIQVVSKSILSEQASECDTFPLADLPARTYSSTGLLHLQVISMRTLALLGKRDPGAPRAFFAHILLASLLVDTPKPNPHLALAILIAFTPTPTLTLAPNPNQVSAYNAALYIASAAVTRLVSNDADVREAFGGVLWVLIPHTQSRILSIAATCLFVPLGKPPLSHNPLTLTPNPNANPNP